MANLVENFIALSCSPLLMLAEKENSNDREFYSPCSRKILMTLSLPEAKGRKCIESRGWLITLGKSGEISLLNPFSREEIELPNLNTFPEYEYYANICSDSQVFFLDRAVLSANPSNTSDYVLMVVHSTELYLGFWKPGNKSWTRIESQGTFSDVNYYNGKFYAISYSGIVWVWDVSWPDLTVVKPVIIIDRQLFRTRCMALMEYSGILRHRHPYMVESSSGDLLVVARNQISTDDNNGDDGVTNFIVIQLDVIKAEWKEIKSLGSNAIFVGHNAAFSIDATRFQDTIKPNCVYFSDDCVESYYERERGGGKDMGIYHLEDGRIERFQDVESFSNISPPLWIAPPCRWWLPT